MISEEIFKPVKGFEKYYLISNRGRLYSFKRKSFIGRDRHGYVGAILFGSRRSKEKREVYIHRLVCEAFLPNPNNYPEINHKDENKKNNCVDNLEWCSSAYNPGYGTRTKRSSEKHKKPVTVEKDGRLIGVFRSIKEASEAIGEKPYNLSSWLHGTKSMLGYVIKEVEA